MLFVFSAIVFVFLAVQLSMVALFLAAQLDQLVLARTAPSASVYNDAEKAMGHLNVALLGANTARSRMAECHEEKMSKCENRKAVREGGSDAAFKQAFAVSMQAPIGDIGARMSQLRNVEVTQPADEDDIDSRDLDLEAALAEVMELPSGADSDDDLKDASKNAEAANFPFCTIDPNIGIVDVVDERLDQLTKLSNSKKK